MSKIEFSKEEKQILVGKIIGYFHWTNLIRILVILMRSFFWIFLLRKLVLTFITVVCTMREQSLNKELIPLVKLSMK